MIKKRDDSMSKKQSMTWSDFFQTKNPRASSVLWVGTIKKGYGSAGLTLKGVIESDHMMLINDRGEPSGIYPINRFVKKSLRPMTKGD
jgi:hypothetical protein